MAETERPHVRCEPSVRFGYPHMRGVSTDAIAGMVWAGESAETVVWEFDLPDRRWVLVACWFEARHGRPRRGYRYVWQQWAQAAGEAMWHGDVDWASIPDPPSREEVRNGA